MAAISRSLLDEVAELHPKQRDAVLHPGAVVVRAGPGSGKTRTLVARAGWVLEAMTPAFRGAACITYTNGAASEVRRRLAALGTRKRELLACGTLHAFCLNEVLRTHAALVGDPPIRAGSVLGDSASEALLQRCFDEIGIGDVLARYRVPQITKIRRAIACGEPLDPFDPREVRAAEMYDQLMREAGEIDFEAMVSRAVKMVRDHAPVRDLLQARFPHLIIDEYQDLGGVLHQLVVTLHDRAGITVFAVGDADQTIFEFAGADPQYLNALSARPDFRDLELEVNYRSGQRIIRASEAALGVARGRRAAEGARPGQVEVVRVQGGLADHALETVRIVQGLLAPGLPAERVGILYPSQGPLLDRLLVQLEAASVPFFYERDNRLPRGTLSRFVQRCASRAVVSAQGRRAAQEERDAGVLTRTEAPTVLDLEDELARLRREAMMPQPASRLHLLRRLQRCLDPTEPYWPEEPAGPWLAQLIADLELEVLAVQHPERENARVPSVLIAAAKATRLTVEDLAAAVAVVGKVMLTTYHSAKGREYEATVLPGLVNEVVPRSVNDRGTWRSPNASELEEQRRAFYVAVSRAEQRTFLVTGPGHETRNGWWRESGPSPFLVEMLRRLDQSP